MITSLLSVTRARPTGLFAGALLVWSLLLSGWAGFAQAEDDDGKEDRGAAQYILGYQETALLPEGDLMLNAKLDTGADYSSIDARDIETFEKDGEDWVRFRIVTEDDDSASFERKVERVARIRSRTGPAIERPVVVMSICVGQLQRMVEVNLADREDFSTPLLIGRDFLEAGVLVNSAAKNTQKPNCEEGHAK